MARRDKAVWASAPPVLQRNQRLRHEAGTFHYACRESPKLTGVTGVKGGSLGHSNRPRMLDFRTTAWSRRKISAFRRLFYANLRILPSIRELKAIFIPISAIQVRFDSSNLSGALGSNLSGCAFFGRVRPATDKTHGRSIGATETLSMHQILPKF